jgi:lysophospholipase L1-like esterase
VAPSGAAAAASGAGSTPRSAAPKPAAPRSAAPARTRRAAPGPLASSPLAPGALRHHSTKAAGSSGRQPGPAAPIEPNDSPDASQLGPPLPLGSLPLGTYVTDQFKSDGIIFSGQAPFITDDGASSTNPTLSGTPLFSGTIVGTFVKPGTDKPATVDQFSIEVGYIDNPGSTQMTVYNSKGQQLGVLVATQEGFNQLYSTFPDAASFSVSSVADEPAGWEMNTIQVGPIDTNYAALGDSYSSGEGTADFPWSASQGTQCDTGPEAWPVQLANLQTNSDPDSPLTISPETLIACQGETTSELNQAVNNESASEIDQLTTYVTKHDSPDLVTFTIGGNDLGFSDILKWCYLGGTETCLHEISSLNEKVSTDAFPLIFTLARAYAAVANAAGPSAQVVVVGYPDLFPQPGGLGTALSVTYNCLWLRDTTFPLLGLSTLVSPYVNRLLGNIENAQAELNEDMSIAAGIAGVQFVPIPYSEYGHELCTSDPWINPLNPLHSGIINNNRNSGHPNVPGSAAIASAVSSSIGLDSNVSPASQGVTPAVFSERTAAAAIARLTGSRPQALKVTGGSLLAGTVGSAYVDFLLNTGGTAATTWSIAKGKLPAGLSLDKAFGTISGTPTKTGKYTFQAEATEGSGKSKKTAKATLSIKIGKVTALKVTTTGLPAATAGQPYAITLAASGGLGATQWAITKGALPSGLVLNPVTGQVTGTPKKAGTAHFTVSATDNESHPQVAKAAESITVVAASAALKVTSSSLPKITAGQDYATDLTSTGGTAPIQWSLSAGSLPPGLSLDAATGLISGSPTSGGTYRFTAQVTDAASPTAHTATRALSIVVSAAPKLAISTASLANGTEGVPYLSVAQATGGAGQYQWSVSSGSLPAGLGIASNTGQLTGTPTATGKYKFQLTATDAAGHSVTRTFTITIARVPLTVSKKLGTAIVGEYYIANVTPAGGRAPYSWTLASGKLPSGLTFDTATGSIVGTPLRRGKFAIKVTVTDSSAPAQQVTAKLTLNVAAAPKLTVSRHALPGGAVSVPYTTGIGFSGGSAPYTWSVKSGKLPAGLTLAPGSGMITGTPTRRGTFSFTIKLADSTKPSKQVATAALRITISKTPSLSISKAALPEATQGNVYVGTLTARGGIAPYYWSVSSGSLPAGLELYGNGEISGTPTGKGTSSFTIEATDSGASPATVKLREKLTVAGASPLTVLTTQLPNAAQESYYEQSVYADGGAGPYSWKLSKGSLPAGLVLDPSGVIYGTPTGFGTSTFTLEATDAATPKASSVRQTLTITVEADS